MSQQTIPNDVFVQGNLSSRTFTPPAAEGTPAPAATNEAGMPPVANAPAAPWRSMQQPEDYFHYGQTTPEWKFFDNVNPVTSAATGGTIKGQGSGQSDEIPAMLSDNEHVIDSTVVSLLGEGSSDEGHRRLEEFKSLIRKRAGMKNTKGIPPKQRGIGSMLAEVTR